MKNSMIIAFSGVITALSVVLLFFGSVVVALAYTMPMVAGILMIMQLESISKKSAFLTYIATSFLAIVLLSDKECALFYIMFFGYYPIVRDAFLKIRLKPLQYISKYMLFNVSMLITQLLCIYVFGIPFEDMFGKWGIIIFIVTLNLIFALYDLLLDKLLILYKYKLKRRIEKYINN